MKTSIQKIFSFPLDKKLSPSLQTVQIMHKNFPNLINDKKNSKKKEIDLALLHETNTAL